jgi:hypothetical protein
VDRRAFIAAILGLLSAPLPAESQPTRKVWQIGLVVQKGAATAYRATSASQEPI